VEFLKCVQNRYFQFSNSLHHLKNLIFGYFHSKVLVLTFSFIFEMISSSTIIIYIRTQIRQLMKYLTACTYSIYFCLCYMGKDPFIGFHHIFAENDITSTMEAPEAKRWLYYYTSSGFEHHTCVQEIEYKIQIMNADHARES
jgi:hypothetical protein